MATVNTAEYDLRGIDRAVKHDVKVLARVWERVKDIKPEKDAKLQRLKELLRGDLKGRKVLVFTYYKDTARYLYRHLGHPENPAAVAFCAEFGGLKVRRMDSGADAKERLRIVEGFAPKSTQASELVSNESLAQQLKQMLESGAREMIESLPDGIHSGQVKAGAKGVFFYFEAGRGKSASTTGATTT